MKKSSFTKTLLMALLIVLLIVLVFCVWKRDYRAKPDCRHYPAESGRACAELSRVCEDDPGCLNAVAHCMPMLAHMDSASGPVPPGAAAHAAAGPTAAEVKACAAAITHMNPHTVAHLAARHGACLPAEYAGAMGSPHNYRELHSMMKAAAPLLPFSLAVAHELPACPAH